MREKILSTAMINIKNKYPEYNDDKLEEISYGLEALYITFTKTIVIFGISLVLNITSSDTLSLIYTIINIEFTIKSSNIKNPIIIRFTE